jgi:hypothetical protein
MDGINLPQLSVTKDDAVSDPRELENVQVQRPKACIIALYAGVLAFRVTLSNKKSRALVSARRPDTGAKVSKFWPLNSMGNRSPKRSGGTALLTSVGLKFSVKFASNVPSSDMCVQVTRPGGKALGIFKSARLPTSEQCNRASRAGIFLSGSLGSICRQTVCPIL